MYAVPVWRDAFGYGCYLKMATTVNKKLAMGICRAYRKAPTAPLEILAGIPPIELVAGKRAEKMRKSKSEKDRATKEIVRKWQNKWSAHDDTWLKRLIPDLTAWGRR